MERCHWLSGSTALLLRPKISAWHVSSAWKIWDMSCAAQKLTIYATASIELRVSLQGINYRMLYFFHGTITVVVSHGIVKERRVPPKEISKAIERKKRFTANPQPYTFKPELSSWQQRGR
jgi:hypothetical protein